jgi:PAS domain S-box-containing protein
MMDLPENKKALVALMNWTQALCEAVQAAFSEKGLNESALSIVEGNRVPDNADLILVGDREDPVEFIESLAMESPEDSVPILALYSQWKEDLRSLETMRPVWETIDVTDLSRKILAGLINAYLRLALSRENRRAQEREGLHKFLEHIADGIIIVDDQGKIMEYNAAALEIFGYKGEDLRGTVFGFPTVAGETAEIEIAQPSGGQVIAEMNVAEVTWRGAPCLLASIRDITARKVANDRMEEALEFSETVISASPLGICIYRPDGQCISTNDSMAEILNVPKERILSQNFREVGQWKELGLINDAEFTLTTAVHSSREINTQTSSGKEVWLDCNFSRFTSGGEPHLLLMATDIWARKQAENLIRKNERRFRTIFEAAPVSMWELDYSPLMAELKTLEERGIKDLRNHLKTELRFPEKAAELIKVINVNSATLKTFGARSKSEILGPIGKVLHPDSMRGFANELIALAEGRQFLEFETVRKTLDNRRLDMLISMGTQDDQKDTYTALCAMVDITERKQAESRLSRELEINEALTELFAPLLSPSVSVPEIAGIVLEKAQYLTDSKHGYVSEIDQIIKNNICHTLTKMMGSGCEVDHQTGVVFPIRKDGKYPGLWGHVLNTRSSLFTNSVANSQFSTGLPEGHIPIERFLGVPVTENGHLLGQIALANSERDYTREDVDAVERLASYYALALQRKRMMKELTNSEERFRQLAENIRDVFLLINVGAGESVDYVSPAYETIWGRARDEAYSDSRAWIRSVHPEDRPRVTEEFRSCLALSNDYSSEFRIIRPDGDIRWVWFKGFSVKDGGDGNRRIAGLAQDITEFKSHQARQKQLMEEIKRFAYIVSHDLRAPLINLKGFSRELKMAMEHLKPIIEAGLEHVEEPLKDEAQLAINEDLPESLEFIDSSATKMNNLVNGILRLSRLGRAELVFEPVDMNEIVNDCLKTLAYQITEGNVDIHVDELPEILADRTSMDQIMNNLIGNAVKFMDSSKPGEIWIGAGQTIDGAMFWVKDNGPGIKEADQRKIFEVFSRVGDQSVPGDGMGLAYVRTLVRRHGGDIWCESTPLEGATFKFTISNRRAREDFNGQF